ncbi:PQQ-dependent sugar dehydrogenase [Flavobacterium sp.]|uniref:PQQ-dependent sugar dehydrogenase n=1 Tax=Flavobacterium sp. TaxID=239 RepID=UPI00286D73AB|nr:PQQ-dependent sugar dehydrogenase [Flavobacterium sp.]
MKYLLLLIPFFGISQTINIQSFATGFDQPVDIENAGDTRLFVVEKTGRIKVINAAGAVNATPFLNLSSLVTTNSERGLLGLAFHPNYVTNGFFYVNYTNLSGNTVIARYSRSSGVGANPDVANATGNILLTINQPYANHNGGSIKFGPDGYLYIGMGDGGSGNDPENRSQNINENLGKMLRIDVNSTTGALQYGIPATNPYVGIAGNDEIWAIGLRNPWKFSFNRLNGDLWIADVGQDAREEVNKIPSPLPTTANFGWRCYEGDIGAITSGCVAQSATYAPIAAPTHSAPDNNCSITGGYVYTGSTYPNLQNKYLFTDLCNSKIGIINAVGTLTYSQDFAGRSFVTFGETNTGELYIGDIGNGTIYRIIDTSLAVQEFAKNGYKIYPNPSKNQVYVEKSEGSFPTEVTIFDLNGKIIAQQKTENIQKNTINTGALASGFYLMNIKDNRETISTHKLVIE